MATQKTKINTQVTSYTFEVVIEPDEDKWAAYCPALLAKGASTWGDTKEEALHNIQEVLQMTVESLHEHGESIPQVKGITISSRPLVTVTLP